jgi:shikimate dehydrogenase
MMKSGQDKLLLGLVGAGIQKSPTPGIHEREASEHGIRCIYQLIDIDQLGLTVDWLPELLASAERMGFSGLNITHPCKQRILPLLTELSEDAYRLGAVNTVLLRNKKRIGYNTDWLGFAENIRQGLDDARMDRVVQLGAGGAGAATAYAVLKLGVKQLTIFDVSADNEEKLVATLALQFGDERVRVGRKLHDAMAQADGLIHATPTGMTGHPSMPLPKALLRPDLWVAEIVYLTFETELLRTARQIGCRTIDGAGMAVYQAARSFELFTGIVPDMKRMAQTFASLRPH